MGNYPNPFNPETTIRFALKKSGKVNIDVYNVRGQKVRTLFKGFKDSGMHSVVWNGLDDRGQALGSGIYFYRLTTDGFAETKKMVLMK
jgi:flagellar hook assembly protein FlgD